MALTKVEEYALSIINGSGTKEAKIKKIMSAFEKEYWFPNNQRYYKGNKINAFAGWLSGLPSGIAVPYTYFDIRKTAIRKGFLPKTATEKRLETFEQKWFHFLAQAFFTAERKLKTKTTTKSKKK